MHWPATSMSSKVLNTAHCDRGPGNLHCNRNTLCLNADTDMAGAETKQAHLSFLSNYILYTLMYSTLLYSTLLCSTLLYSGQDAPKMPPSRSQAALSSQGAPKGPPRHTTLLCNLSYRPRADFAVGTSITYNKFVPPRLQWKTVHIRSR
jgi:hypothetical protein